MLIMLFFLLIIGSLGVLAGYIYQSIGVTITVLVVATVYALIQYFAASSQAMSLAGGQEITDPNQNIRLWRIVENLAISDGMDMPRVFVIQDPSPNAFATGRDPKHAMVAATTGLLDMLDDSELEGVMAHELSHVKNYDIRVSMIVFGLVVAIGMLADLLFRLSLFGGNNRNNSGGNPIMLVIGLAAMLVAPLVAGVVQAAVSRQREYLADASGAMLTRHPEGLANALWKISGGATGGVQPPPMRRANTSMAHMWFASPLSGGGMSKLFSTHPPIQDRINRLMKNSDRF